ncbi:phosphoenolpyruvate synthase [Nocardioides daeguensis]|uniref:Phosphoenolpyruvate synthase n=1 Tax=Nocardioides daeguensis TaxID=908359 RepID=A0ABP6UT13_9ACTN|nr:phosphoenolpyruvate synthase [Nocardioides daeguensis]MBV6728364.1 phosphoenolpyruvate synthase [Nocardioides daeguensis]MCR1773173.1 phosphoenolpyruvate synthase [Nocardioides daeguensis]
MEPTSEPLTKVPPFVRAFTDLGLSDIAEVGGKNAGIGELHQVLVDTPVRVPDGFAVTADAYRHTLTSADLWRPLRTLFADLDLDDPDDLARRAEQARSLVAGAELPEDLVAQIRTAHQALEAVHGPDLAVAVRSSATAEDLPEASFAGQHDSYLQVIGADELVDAVRRCFASAFTARGVHYRARHGYGQLDVALSVGVMAMVRSAASGVVFTLDPESGHRGVVLLSSAWGVGENVVQGRVDPDEFHVHKATYEAGFRAVLHRRLGTKEIRTVVGPDGLRDEATPDPDRRRFSLGDDDVLDLAGAALSIERHVGRPMDIEFAKDEQDQRLYVVQARPATGTATRETAVMERFAVVSPGPVLATGRAVGNRAATGRVRVVRSTTDLAAFQPGEVLVATTTTPDWEPVMKTAAAVVTDRGGRTCHAAIIARELGLPAVVGTGDGTAVIRDGDEVTVSCAGGETGRVHAGAAEVRVDQVRLDELPRPRTRMMVNLGNPSLALGTSLLPCDGVGLARTEFIFSTSVRVHPLAALHPDQVTDPAERARVEELVGPDGASYVVQRLAEGVGMIAAAFHPRPVVVRLSDFKTNEYADLLGGRDFEPHEANPMLGFRGASRYAHPAYAEGFALECEAMRQVRDEMGLTNVVLMLPFVRRIAEADLVLGRMAELGLARGNNDLAVFAMCEIPNNVVLVDDFAQRFDGLSIGSNDLTQLTLGVDRDSDVVAFDYDERDPGVLRMIELAVEGCRRNGIHSGICGQAPSDHPEVAQFLVRAGIDSMSLSPDSLVPMLQVVHDAEVALAADRASTTGPGRTWEPWCSATETHSGAVVLLGDLAFKVKKPVQLGFLDFREHAARRQVCEREVELNRRLAPDVYLGVGSLSAPGGADEPAVVMRRLPDERRLTHLVRSGQDVSDDVRAIAHQVAAFHTRATTSPEIAHEGTRQALRSRWEANLARAGATGHPALTPEALSEVTGLVHRFLDGREDLFVDRLRRGAVVDGHGDLTTDDVFCLDDGPRLLDCLEFDDRLRYVDRLDDIAFLAMGLDQLGAADSARLLIDTWSSCVGDPAPPSLVHHFMAYRAFVRAEVGALRGAQHGTDVASYLAATLDHLRAGAVALVLVGGPPASGKSTLAGAIADRLGMVVLSTDRVRKEIAGLDPATHAPAAFGAGIYTAEHTRATYAAVLERAERLLRRGESVVLDGTWSHASDREQAADLAARTSSDLVELCCEIDEATARRRIVTRDSISDADEGVANRMRTEAAPWPSAHPIDTSTELAASTDLACRLVRPHPVPAAVPVSPRPAT